MHARALAKQEAAGAANNELGLLQRVSALEEYIDFLENFENAATGALDLIGPAGIDAGPDAEHADLPQGLLLAFLLLFFQLIVLGRGWRRRSVGEGGSTSDPKGRPHGHAADSTADDQSRPSGGVRASYSATVQTSQDTLRGALPDSRMPLEIPYYSEWKQWHIVVEEDLFSDFQFRIGHYIPIVLFAKMLLSFAPPVAKALLSTVPLAGAFALR
jgi:hypothetical protein